MNRVTPTPPSTLITRHRHPMALALGLCLGQIVALMAQREGANWMGFGLSTVFVAAASASFVMFVLGLYQRRAPLPRQVLSRQAHLLAGAIGVGLLVSLKFVA